MIKNLILFSFLMLSSLFVQAQSRSATAYANKYGDLAISEMRRTGIPASITLAQGIIESGGGTTALARKANNHFGVKAGRNWTGQRYGNFRKYETVEQAFDDRSDFLTKRKTYALLFKLDKCDYKAWARGLQRSGYATSKKYADDLIRCINNNKLYKYDEAVCGEHKIEELATAPDSVISESTVVNSKPSVDHVYYKIKKGDTLSEIAKKHGTTVKQLHKLNSVKSTNLKPGQKIRVR